MRTAAVLALACSSCGRLGFVDRDAAGVARGDGGGDAPLDANLLGLTWTNIAPVAALNLSTSDEDDPTLTADLLEIYFDSDRPGPGTGMGDIWMSSRASVTDAWSAPVLVAPLASPADDTTPEVAADGLSMYFASDRLNPGDRDIYVTTRATRNDPWGAPTRVAELSSSLTDDSAEPLPDGLHLVMSRGANMLLDLMVSTRSTKTSPWGAPVPLPGLDDPMYDESQQWASPDLNVVYYVTDRPPAMSQDIWLATRPDSQSAFTSTLVTELQSPVIDVDPWVSPDGHTLFFASRRNGSVDIFTASR
ncbi:MAG: PD40 domain-containing protein [Deltaproteobacteria bacterium]|nr:PD40 domain-containing protein [Deltaproteobacteria bacterium]